MDATEAPLECHTEQCIGLPQITYAYWGDVQVMNHGRPTQELTDRHGYRRKFAALDDPLCQIDLGVHQDQSSNGIRAFPEELSREFRDRITRDGDSPKLRDDMLSVRQSLKSAPSP